MSIVVTDVEYVEWYVADQVENSHDVALAFSQTVSITYGWTYTKLSKFVIVSPDGRVSDNFKVASPSVFTYAKATPYIKPAIKLTVIEFSVCDGSEATCNICRCPSWMCNPISGSNIFSQHATDLSVWNWNIAAPLVFSNVKV